jgi:hypothetical protein
LVASDVGEKLSRYAATNTVVGVFVIVIVTWGPPTGIVIVRNPQFPEHEKAPGKLFGAENVDAVASRNRRFAPTIVSVPSMVTVPEERVAAESGDSKTTRQRAKDASLSRHTERESIGDHPYTDRDFQH